MVHDIALLTFEKQLDDLIEAKWFQLLLPRLSVGVGIWWDFGWHQVVDVHFCGENLSLNE
jgi:hypothetical protein